MKILLTGANGFIGRNLTNILMDKHDVHYYGRTELNLLNSDALEEHLKQERYDLVIHSANVNSSRGIVVEPYNVLHGNLTMFYNLEKCKKYFGRMFYFGSGAEFDQRNYIPKMTEDYFGKYIPGDAYGLSKYIMAREAQKENNIYNLRLFGVFGPYEEWTHRFISNAICRALKNMPITITQNVFFDYLWIDDLAGIIEKMSNGDLEHKHYNVCSGTRVDLYSIAKLVKTCVGCDVPILISKEGLKLEYTGDNNRILKEIKGYEFTPLKKAINKLIEYYRTIIDSIDCELL